MKKNPKQPSYTTILKSIRKAKTSKQFLKVTDQVMNYSGSPYKVSTLLAVHNKKAQKRYAKSLNKKGKIVFKTNGKEKIILSYKPKALKFYITSKTK